MNAKKQGMKKIKKETASLPQDYSLFFFFFFLLLRRSRFQYQGPLCAGSAFGEKWYYCKMTAKSNCGHIPQKKDLHSCYRSPSLTELSLQYLETRTAHFPDMSKQVKFKLLALFIFFIFNIDICILSQKWNNKCSIYVFLVIKASHKYKVTVPTLLCIR